MIDARSFDCERCGASPGEPCTTVRDAHGGEKYRGKGEAADHAHSSRLVQLVNAWRAAGLSHPPTNEGD